MLAYQRQVVNVKLELMRINLTIRNIMRMSCFFYTHDFLFFGYVLMLFIFYFLISTFFIVIPSDDNTVGSVV
jgi:hypothetical protein